MKNPFKRKKKNKRSSQFMSVTTGDGHKIILTSDKKDNTTAKEDTVYYNKRYPYQGGKFGRNQTMTDWKHFVYINTLLDLRVHHFGNPYDRMMMALFHPFYSAYINGVADALTKEAFMFIDPNDVDEKEPKSKKHITNWWRRERLQEMSRIAFARLRQDGYVIYYPVDKNKYPDYWGRGGWFVFSDEEAEAEAWDDWGHPIGWVINVHSANSAPAIQNLHITINDCFYFDPNYTQDNIPIPEGSQIWDDCVDLVAIKEAMKSFDQRMGNGFMTMTIPETIWSDENAMTKIEQKLKNIKTDTGMLLPAGNKETDLPYSVTWQGMSGTQVDFVSHLDKYEEDIAVGMRFPKRWVKGDSEGAMESSGKDKLQAHIRLQEIFKKYIPFVKGVLKFHGKIQSYDDIEVIHGLKLELTDQEKAEMDLVITHNITSKTFLTPNEQRKEAGYGPTEGGDKLLSETEDTQSNSVPPSENKDNPKPHKKVSQGFSKTELKADNKLDTLENLLNMFSIRELANHLGVSTNTVSKMRSNMVIPVMHETTQKLDSVQISDDIWEFEGPLITPITRNDYDSGNFQRYEDFDGYDIRPANEIKKWWKSNSPKELHLGVTPTSDHSSRIQLEVLEPNSIGITKATKLMDDGSIWGKRTINMKKVDKILGTDNWVRRYHKEGKQLPSSIALWSKDVYKGDERINTRLDPRSEVLTKSPRNRKTFSE